MVEEDDQEIFSDVDDNKTLDLHRLLTRSLAIRVIDIQIPKKIRKVFGFYPTA